MKTKCSQCKYYKYSQVLGSPFKYKWKCTRQDGKMFQRSGQPERNESSPLECFEPRDVPFWRVPVGVIVGVWISAVLFIAFYFIGVGMHLSGDYRPVPIVVPIIIAVMSIAVGIFGSIEWYKRRL